ncbi:Transport and Golgi organization protein 6 [Tritrichomonas musculus]|uniref:Transport and Golgi organization protein 6 n=1 Tax=Tritrichomonas musculus TaxID=1915356 RepID=A0ABR2LBD9_9EUKA
MSNETNFDPRFDTLIQMFKELPQDTPIDKALPQLPQYVSGIEHTGNIYFDLPFLCATIIIECGPQIEESMISRVNASRKLLQCVISWGIYPHLPKSLHIKFLDKPHWLDTEAPPRLLRPNPIMMNALDSFLSNPGLSLIHPLFVQHAICIFYYLEPERLPHVIENQKTETVIASILALFPTGLKLMQLLIDTIKERTDSFEALENTTFPPKLCARAISAVPEKDDPDEYYKKLMSRVFSAIESKKGDTLAKYILTNSIQYFSKQFYQNFDLSSLLEWPTEQNIAPLLYKLETYFFPTDLQKLLIEPLPQRIAFIAALTTGEINNRAIRILQSYMKNDELAVDLILSIAENATLSPIGLDNYTIIHNDKGLFAVVDDEREDDFDIISQMLKDLGEIIDLKNTIKIVNLLPPVMNGINFISQIISRYKEIDEELAICLLNFISKLDQNQGKADVGADIAKLVIEMCPSLKSVPQNVVDSLGEFVPEIRLLSIINENEKNSNSDDFEFDKNQLLQDLVSPTVPLRARGLYTLRRGVMKKGHPLRDEKVIKSIFPTIEKQLKDKDSFVFMNAIFCLESIADVFPHLVIETLANQFPQKDEALSLKVGQVLMLCARRTGPGLVHSADGNLCGHFIKAFARGVQHNSSLVQASSLSDLSTFVEALSFGCFPWFTDIVATVKSSWQAHKPIPVRRAASYTVYKIVQTMGKGFEEFSKDDLMNLIDCVKMNRGGEVDEVAHQNAEDCYQTLWDICPMLL